MVYTLYGCTMYCYIRFVVDSFDLYMKTFYYDLMVNGFKITHDQYSSIYLEMIQI